MHVLLLIQYYLPENVGPATWAHELACDLRKHGHRVTVLTGFPHYPKGEVFPGYRGKIYQRETIDGIEVIRTWLFASPSKALLPRLLNYGSFCVSSFLGGCLSRVEPDVIYAFMPPLPLGVAAVALARKKKAKVVINIQDLMPDMAVATGVLKNQRAISLFSKMERWIYAHCDHVVVISEGFRQNLIAKGVAPSKIEIISNWADPVFFRAGNRDNRFRQEHGINGEFTVIYSGGLTLNSNLAPVVQAANLLRKDPVRFLIIGEGARKRSVEDLAASFELQNLSFLPFQPWARYPEVLRAADLNLVTLNREAAQVSVPSKIFKQMASGRPVLAIASEGTAIAQLVNSAHCGICVPPDDPEALAAAIRWACDHPVELQQMGENARRHLQDHFSREICTRATANMIDRVLGHKLNEV